MGQEKVVYEIPKMDIYNFDDGVLTDIVQGSNLGDISGTPGSNYDDFFNGF